MKKAFRQQKLKRYIFFGFLVYVGLAIYFEHTIKTSEVFPLFSWSLFSVIPS